MKCETRVPGGRAITSPARIGCVSRSTPSEAARGEGHSSSVPSPSSTTNASSSTEWQCGIASSAWGSRIAHFSPVFTEPAASATILSPSSSSSTSSRATTLAGLRLDHPRVVVAPLEPEVAEPHRARARQPAVLHRMARPEDDVLEAVGAGADRVLLTVSEMDDRIARAHGADLLVLPQEPRARDDEEDLLRARVRVRRRRQPAGVD